MTTSFKSSELANSRLAYSKRFQNFIVRRWQRFWNWWTVRHYQSLS